MISHQEYGSCVTTLQKSKHRATQVNVLFKFSQNACVLFIAITEKQFCNITTKTRDSKAGEVNTNVGEDREVSDALQDAKPDANVLDPLRPGTPALTQVLVGIDADLHNVI